MINARSNLLNLFNLLYKLLFLLEISKLENRDKPSCFLM
jgi:hypothetical protein